MVLNTTSDILPLSWSRIEYATRTVCGERSHRFGVGQFDALDSQSEEASAKYMGGVKELIFQFQPLALAGHFQITNCHVTEYLDGGGKPLLASMLASHAQYDIEMTRTPEDPELDWLPRVIS